MWFLPILCLLLAACYLAKSLLRRRADTMRPWQVALCRLLATALPYVWLLLAIWLVCLAWVFYFVLSSD